MFSTFRAAARTSAAEAVLLLTSTYKGVSKSGKDGSFDGIPLGRVCCNFRLNDLKEVQGRMVRYHYRVINLINKSSVEKVDT